MSRFLKYILPCSLHAADTKRERNYISEGNSLYRQQRYAEAETMYKKALTVAPASETARFNLASALIRQAGSADPNKGNTPMEDAVKLLTELAETAQAVNIAERASYDLGNIAFNGQQYQQAIDHYKNALRKNPDNDKARQNLRLAQKKLEEQQKNQDQNKDQQQNKDQEKKQDQNKDQNQQNKQDQNKDKPDQDKQNQQQDQKKDQQQPPKQQQGGGISDENAQKILKAMENEEAATRKKIEARKQKADNARRRQVTKPW